MKQVFVVFTLALSFLLTNSASAQNWIFATDSLWTDSIKAFVRSDGAIFQRDGNYGLYVGNDSIGLTAGGGLWIGGLDQGGQLRISLHNWSVWQSGNHDFWPGPLSAMTGLTDSTTTANYNQIWKLSRSEWEAFQLDFADNGIIDTPAAYPNVYNWPAFLTDLNGNTLPEGAPWVDIDGDPNTYSPDNGDHPEMHGDQMCWWVFNDVGPGQARYSGPSLGVEIHSLMYVFDCPYGPYMSNNVFLEYEVINRGASAFSDVYLGQWLDFDIGNGFDDHLGIDTTNALFYGFNGDTDDNGKFGLTAPALGIQLLQGVTPDNRFSHFMTYANNFAQTPVTAAEHYGMMQAYFPDGQHLVDNYSNGGVGNGHPDSSAGPLSNYQFPGSTCAGTGWTMQNANILPQDFRGIGSMGPFSLGSGQSRVSQLAFVYGGGATSTLNTCLLFDAAQAVRDWHNTQSPSCLVPDLVFPGDANHDQVANVWDLLPIGVHFQQVGPVRTNSTLNWVGQIAAPWYDSLSNGVDIKHVDTDGNGIIEVADTLAISQNYGLTHSSFKTNSSQSGGADLYLTYSDTLIDPGDTLVVTAWLGMPDSLVNNVYGIAFSLDFDTSLVSSVSVKLDSTWLGTPGQDLLTMSRVHPLEGKIDLAEVRLNQIMVNGHGRIGSIIIVMDDDIAKRRVPFSLPISEATLIDNAENPIPLAIQQSNINIQTGIPGQLEIAGLQIYPNPAHESVQIRWEGSAETVVELVDIQGRIWLRAESIGEQGIGMDVTPLPTGLYLVRVGRQGNVTTKKIMVR